MKCAICEKPIDSTRHAHRWVSGWEKDRKQGGTNALRCREPADLWAHDHCVDLMARGIPPAQEALL